MSEQPSLFGVPRVGVMTFPEGLTATRQGRTSYAFNRLPNRGIRKIVAELEQPFATCTPAELDRFDWVLVPLHSFLDVCNVILFLPMARRCKVLVGGPACNNIRPLLGRIDAANFGRCDSGKINQILAGKRLASVWRAGQDPDFSNVYQVDHGTPAGLALDERAAGCHKRCAFCFYSWWNGPRPPAEHYQGGVGDQEDFLQALDWRTAIRGAVTAIDGQTAAIRRWVGKPLSVAQMVATLRRANDVDYARALRVKIYTIIGYPGDDARAAVDTDLVDACRRADPDMRRPIVLRLKPTHFIPYQKTPLWNQPFNDTDMRPIGAANPVLFEGKQITLWGGANYTPTPIAAMLGTILQRAGNADRERVEQCAQWYARSWDSKTTCRKMKQLCGDLLAQPAAEVLANVITGTEGLR